MKNAFPLLLLPLISFGQDATLDWHKHATPQVLIVTEGRGYYQERGKVPIIIKEGDVLKCNSNQMDRENDPGIP